MTQFVHLADSRIIGNITRSGITAAKLQSPFHLLHQGVFCVPVTPDHYRTHQWLRELRRRGLRSFHAVQFALKADMRVWLGRYNETHIEVTASEAAGIFMRHESALGLEIIVPHHIPAAAISRIYSLRQVTGWRFYPEAKGRQPYCRCYYCNRGEINARKVMDPEFR